MRITQELTHLSTPVASPWRAACHLTGRNSTRPILPSSWYCLKWFSSICREISRISFTAKEQLLNGSREWYKINKVTGGKRNKRQENIEGIEGTLLTTVNDVPELQVTGSPNAMDNKDQMINLVWLTWENRTIFWSEWKQWAWINCALLHVRNPQLPKIQIK